MLLAVPQAVAAPRGEGGGYSSGATGCIKAPSELPVWRFTGLLIRGRRRFITVLRQHVQGGGGGWLWQASGRVCDKYMPLPHAYMRDSRSGGRDGSALGPFPSMGEKEEHANDW